MNAEVSIDVDFLEQLPAKTMLRMVEQAQQAKKYIALFSTTVKALSPLFRALETLDIEPRFDLSGGSIDISFTGNAEKLRAVWVDLRRAGYKPNVRPEKGKVWMNFSISVCRKVQIGTETKEVPIYETQCDELPGIELLDGGLPIAIAAPSEEVPF